MTPFQSFSREYDPQQRLAIEQALTTAMHLIRQFEGCRLRAYRCPAGIWTIGWWHTKNVRQGDIWTQEQADHVLKEDIVQYARNVHLHTQHLIDYPNRFAACISLAYNIGINAFARSSLCRHIHGMKWNMAAEAFKSWRFVNRRENQGLIRRRTIERQIFLKDSQ